MEEALWISWDNYRPNKLDLPEVKEYLGHEYVNQAKYANLFYRSNHCTDALIQKITDPIVAFDSGQTPIIRKCRI